MIGFLNEEALDLLKFLKRVNAVGDESYSLVELMDRLTVYLTEQGEIDKLEE
jgi:hypothetical protein